MKRLFLLLALFFTLSNAVQAQGLVGASPETRLGRSDEQTIRADQQYEFYKKALIAITVTVALVSVGISGRMLSKNGKGTLAKATLVSVGVPLGTYVIGTLLLNIFG